MAGNLQERLKWLRERFTGKSRDEPIAHTPQQTTRADATQPAATVGFPGGERKTQTVSINLGIDFGTSFTKVCFRDVGTEESFVMGPAGALIPTVVAIDAKGRLYLGDRPPCDAPVTTVRYLKMRLAGMALGEDLAAVNGVDLNGEKAARALSSWFLASVLKRSQDWIGRNERNRMKNRTPVWSANVGVPVEYCDSNAIKIFEEVHGVAWLWLKSGSVPRSLLEALTAYDHSVPLLPSQSKDFHAIPEIAAAVHSFVMSRESVPGIYIYFDIGGGTVDGVAFKLVNESGERKIDFYSGKVGPLGISALAMVLGSAGDNGRPDFVERLVQSANSSATERFAHSIRELVGHVIVAGKMNDVGRHGTWQRAAFQGGTFERKFIGALDPSRMAPLVVFLGGGGSRSEWYSAVIGSTYHKFRHDNGGIPPYKLLEVPKPADLSMRGLPEAEFRRFAISYGLSIPYGEVPVRLPSQFDVPEEPRLWTLPGLVDYADTRDVYD
jgi:hypothetical protein